MAELEKRMRANIEQMDPETMLRTWLPAGMQGLEQIQKAFWSQLAGSTGGVKPGEK